MFLKTIGAFLNIDILLLNILFMHIHPDFTSNVFGNSDNVRNDVLHFRYL
ncbi:MAG: hypothetical protein ACI8RP_001071, partial [Urechidicola sp.]